MFVFVNKSNNLGIVAYYCRCLIHFKIIKFQIIVIISFDYFDSMLLQIPHQAIILIRILRTPHQAMIPNSSVRCSFLF